MCRNNVADQLRAPPFPAGPRFDYIRGFMHARIRAQLPRVHLVCSGGEALVRAGNAVQQHSAIFKLKAS